MISLLKAVACAILLALLAGMAGSVGVFPSITQRGDVRFAESQNQCEFGAVRGGDDSIMCDQYRDDELPFFPAPDFDDDGYDAFPADKQPAAPLQAEKIYAAQEARK
jgi:hypothetical protein